MEYRVHDISKNTPDRKVELNSTLQETISQFEVPSFFEKGNTFIELNIYSENGTLLLSDLNYRRYKVRNPRRESGEFNKIRNLVINPIEDVEDYMVEKNTVKLEYNFLKDITTGTYKKDNFIINLIPGNRTEIRLRVFNAERNTVEKRVTQFKEELEKKNFIKDVYLYLGETTYFRILNIKTEEEEGELFIDLKVATPLPEEIEAGKLATIVEQIADTRTYLVEPVEEVVKKKHTQLGSPNFTLEVETEENEETDSLNYEDLLSVKAVNRSDEIESILSESSVKLDIDYQDWSDFINFSSAEERVLNFVYKVTLLEKHRKALEQLNTQENDSRRVLEQKIKGIIRNFDHFEKYLYYEDTEIGWPKEPGEKPYTLKLSTAPEVVTWKESILESARQYDLQNINNLENTIPEYIRESEDNRNYIVFINMIGHHFDNLWIYAKKLSDRYDADNRLDKGVSSDIVEEVLKSLGVKIYTSTNSIEDLFNYFVRSESNNDQDRVILHEIQEGEKTSLEDYDKQVYKRIYHNLPLLLKTKGTERGIRALINCFGIPESILKIRTFEETTLPTPDFGEDTIIEGTQQSVEVVEKDEVEGKVLSRNTGISKNRKNRGIKKQRIDIGFNPQLKEEEELLKELPRPFLIDQYIGDPTQPERRKYRSLEKVVKQALHEVDKIEMREFVELVKYFDNRLFRMVLDFLPSKATVNRGLIIGSTNIRRSVAETPVVSYTQDIIEAFLKVGEYSAKSGGSYETSKQDYITDYENLIQTPVGLRNKDKTGEQARFDGELKGTELEVINGELNEDNPFKKLKYDEVRYDIRFLSIVPEDLCSIRRSRKPLLIRESEGTSFDSVDLTEYFDNYSLTQTISHRGKIEYNPGNIGSGFGTPSSADITGLLNPVEIENPSDFNLKEAEDENGDRLNIGNYDRLRIRIEREGTDMPPPDFPQNDRCVIDINLRVVFCYLDVKSAAEDLTVSKYIEVNLEDYFDGVDEGENTEVVYYEEYNGNLFEIENPTTYKVINEERDEDSEVLIKVEDSFDRQCSKEIRPKYILCPITENSIGKGLSKDSSDLTYKRRPRLASQTKVGNPWQNTVGTAGSTREAKALYIPRYFNVGEQVDPARVETPEQGPQYTYVRYYFELFSKEDENSDLESMGRIYSNYSGVNENTGFSGVPQLSIPILSPRRAFDEENVVEIEEDQKGQDRGDIELEFKTQFMVPLTYWDILSMQGRTLSTNSEGDYERQEYLYLDTTEVTERFFGGRGEFYNGEKLGINLSIIRPEFVLPTQKFYIRLGVEFGDRNDGCFEETEIIEIEQGELETVNTEGGGYVDPGDTQTPPSNGKRSPMGSGNTTPDNHVCTSATATVDIWITGAGNGIQVNNIIYEDAANNTPLDGNGQKWLITRGSNKSTATIDSNGKITGVTSCNDSDTGSGTGETGGTVVGPTKPGLE